MKEEIDNTGKIVVSTYTIIILLAILLTSLSVYSQEIKYKSTYNGPIMIANINRPQLPNDVVWEDNVIFNIDETNMTFKRTDFEGDLEEYEIESYIESYRQDSISSIMYKVKDLGRIVLSKIYGKHEDYVTILVELQYHEDLYKGHLCQVYYVREEFITQ